MRALAFLLALLILWLIGAPTHDEIGFVIIMTALGGPIWIVVAWWKQLLVLALLGVLIVKGGAR